MYVAKDIDARINRCAQYLVHGPSSLFLVLFLFGNCCIQFSNRPFSLSSRFGILRVFVPQEMEKGKIGQSIEIV